MLVKLPCKIYNRPVEKNHQGIECDTCDTWVHLECNKIKSNKICNKIKLLQNEKKHQIVLHYF